MTDQFRISRGSMTRINDVINETMTDHREMEIDEHLVDRNLSLLLKEVYLIPEMQFRKPKYEFAKFENS